MAVAAADRAHWTERVTLSGFVDAYTAHNDNRPADHANFVAGTGSSGKRSAEFGVNLAALDLAMPASPASSLGARLTLVTGSGAEIIHGGEPEGPGAGSESWEMIYQAYFTYVAPVGSGLAIDAGVFPCHAGFESFFSRDNWNYTRSWLGEFSPYYMSGVRATYAVTPRVSAQLGVANGWQTIADNNEGKTLGTQLAWNSERVTASINTMAGPELSGDNDHWRLFLDNILVVRPTSRIALAVNADFASQALRGGDSADWQAVAGYVRVAPHEKAAIAVRREFFDDDDGGVTGLAQRFTESTITIEFRPEERLILKLEGRHDSSTAAVFGTRQTDGDGAPRTDTRQDLVLLGAVVTF